MKKAKLLIPTISSLAIVSIMAPVLSSCSCSKEDKTITPVIDQETQAKFESIKFSCELNKESTITFVPKSGEELIASSIEIKVDNKLLETQKDYTVVENTVNIFAHAMTSKNLTLKASSQTIHFEPTITDETKAQFDSITSNCHVGQDSTLTFIPKQDQEIDPLSVSIKIDQVALEETKDYKIHNNIITIYASAMKSRNITVSVNARYQHVIDCLEPSWIVKPLMTNDTMTANDIIVYLNYKDGTQETLDWGEEGYEIYQVKKDGSKVKLENFKTQPFVFAIPGQDYNFEIVYSKDTRVTLPVNGVFVNEPTESLFLAKYKQCLDNYKESEIINKYGWVTFDQDSTFMEQPVVSAALVYDYNGARAHFKNHIGEATDYDCIVGGYDIEQLKETLEEYDYADYTTEFINTTKEFGFKVTKVAAPTEKNEVLFNKETYVTNWENTMTDDVGEPYQGTKITNIKYTDYVKTVELNMDITKSPLISMSAFDTIVQDQPKKFITEVNNEFILKFKTQNETRKGKFVVYNKGTQVCQTEDMIINDEDKQQIKLKISNWDNIDHNAILTVRFEAYETISVKLDPTLTDIYWKEGTSVEVNSSQPEWKPQLFANQGKVTKDGTYYISANIDGKDVILARSEFNEGFEGSYTPIFKFDYLTTWYPVGKTSIVPATLKFTEAREAKLEVGSRIQQELSPTIEPSEMKIVEDYNASKVDINWSAPLEKDTIFTLTTKSDYPEDLVLVKVKAGATNVTLSFNEWDKITSGDTLIVNIKADSKLNVTCENDTYKLIEPQPKQYQYVEMNLVPGYFKFADPASEWVGHVVWFVKIDNFKQTAGTASGWKLWPDWHSVQWFDNEWLHVQLIGDGKITPHEGDEYTFDMTLTFDGEDTYKEFKFENIKIQVYWPH